MSKVVRDARPHGTYSGGEGETKGVLERRGPEIFLVVLLIYLVLLGIGVFAEVFKIQAILGWWIWRAPEAAPPVRYSIIRLPGEVCSLAGNSIRTSPRLVLHVMR